MLRAVAGVRVEQDGAQRWGRFGPACGANQSDSAPDSYCLIEGAGT